ncbi:hypothetical protein GOBAR_AA03935 [Gossypium barbadense]|uniref:Uncharacterized protein n=1 Tax=Gossypium barbadense TaxID=3634 RepID=A0A2P5YM30_GOSBA|nr:hypothetical protein GOBAR_AA03935 [Gossypium barbadense]
MFFIRIFVNNSELRGYYEENHEKGEFFCLVCGGIGENLVLGWDIDRLLVILLKGEPLSPILANSSESQLDRFIPNRSAMDYDYAHYMLIEGRKIKENQTVFSPAKDAYRMQLAEALNMNRT